MVHVIADQYKLGRRYGKNFEEAFSFLLLFHQPNIDHHQISSARLELPFQQHAP